MGQRVFSNADARDLQIAIDILKAHTHAATIPALALVKRHFFFSISRFAVEESFLAICF